MNEIIDLLQKRAEELGNDLRGDLEAVAKAQNALAAAEGRLSDRRDSIAQCEAAIEKLKG